MGDITVTAVNENGEAQSLAVRAGKRTYFFDVKATKNNDHYLTITESKKISEQGSGKFHFEKHKLFLYKEDFENFMEGLNAAIEIITPGLSKKAAAPKKKYKEDNHEDDLLDKYEDDDDFYGDDDFSVPAFSSIEFDDDIEF